MNTPRFAKLVARWLSQLDVPRVPDAEARARSVQTVERALALRKQRRRWRRVGLASATAACAAAALLLLLQGAGQPRRQLSSAPRLVAMPIGAGAWLGPVATAVPLSANVELRAPALLTTAADGGAQLVFATGTRIDVESSSSLEVLSQDSLQRLSLASGALFARVAKLATGERFVANLPGAEIEVRGTAFHLAVRHDCPAGARAAVRVEEGRVEVRTATETLQLAAGESWQAACKVEVAAPVPQAEPPSQPQLESPSHPQPEPQSPASRTTAAPPASTRAAPSKVSMLTEQNTLFAEAVAARQRGEVDRALAGYARIAERFPASALAESALLARVRLLAQRDGASARSEAERFLGRYPHSFARREVEALLEPQ